MSWRYHSDLSDFRFTPNIPHKASRPFKYIARSTAYAMGLTPLKFIFPAGGKVNHIDHSCKKFLFKRMGLCHWTHSLKFIFLSGRLRTNHRRSLLWEFILIVIGLIAAFYAMGLTPVSLEFFRGSLKGYHNNQLFLFGQKSVDISETGLQPSYLSCWTQLLYKFSEDLNRGKHILISSYAIPSLQFCSEVKLNA